MFQAAGLSERRSEVDLLAVQHAASGPKRTEAPRERSMIAGQATSGRRPNERDPYLGSCKVAVAKGPSCSRLQ